MSCMTDLFFFSVIVSDAAGLFLSVFKSDILLVGRLPVIVDSCDLKFSLGRCRLPAVLFLGERDGFSRYPKSLGST